MLLRSQRNYRYALEGLEVATHKKAFKSRQERKAFIAAMLERFLPKIGYGSPDPHVKSMGPFVKAE